MMIETIRLVNYRCHRDLKEVRFAPGFNVLVGANGSGKTSLLRALADSFFGFTGYLPITSHPLPNDDAVRLERVEIDGHLRFEHQYPVIIETAGVFNSKPVTWTLTRSAAAGFFAPTGTLPGAMWQKDNNDAGNGVGATLPILAFYRAERQWNQPQPQEIVAATQRPGRFDAYASYWNASSDSHALQAWAISKCLERFQVSSETGKMFDEFQDDELALVNRALADAIDDVESIRNDMREKRLMVEWRGAETSAAKRFTIFENLSDGQKAIIGLVTDIARRICLLNPHLGHEVMQNTPGVVLIDELDVHLHPKWQRSLTRGLQAAFPSIQFIVASHSPQVLSEMQPEQIIVLTSDSPSNPAVSYGLDSSSVLEEIMGATARPMEVEEALSALFESLERNELDVARLQLAELQKQAPGIAELNRAKSLLKRKEVVGRCANRTRKDDGTFDDFAHVIARYADQLIASPEDPR
jgi:predicted ATP-binding protein involved in virulence